MVGLACRVLWTSEVETAGTAVVTVVSGAAMVGVTVGVVEVEPASRETSVPVLGALTCCDLWISEVETAGTAVVTVVSGAAIEPLAAEAGKVMAGVVTVEVTVEVVEVEPTGLRGIGDGSTGYILRLLVQG